MVSFRRAGASAFLCLLLAAPAARAQEELSYQEAFQRLVFSHAAEFSATLSREERIALATNFPGIFGFRFVCIHRPDSGNESSVLPGDLVEAAGKGRVSCPGGFDVHLEAGAKLRILQLEGGPEVRLEAGAGRLTFGKVKLSVAAGGLVLHAEGKGTLQELELRPEQGEVAFICAKGNLEATLEVGPSGAKNFLASRLCRMQVRGEPDTPVSQVMPGDAYAVANRLVPPNFLPDQSAILGPKGVLPIEVRLDASALALQFTILAMGPSRKATCELMLVPSSGQPAKPLKTVAVEGSTGSISLDASAPGQGYFMVCEDEGGVFASPLVTVP